jgi:hypothetical protein
MASAASACASATAYDTYINGAPANSNLAESPREGQYGRADYTYLNNLLQPSLNPHAGVLPNTSRSYIQNTYLGGSSAHMDLSILDSETHNDGRVIEEIRSSSGAGSRRNATPLHDMAMKRDAAADVGSEVGSSKQSERSSKKSRKNSHESDDEGTGKKARGRPRVDTTDETAADVSLSPPVVGTLSHCGMPGPYAYSSVASTDTDKTSPKGLPVTQRDHYLVIEGTGFRIAVRD